MKHWIAIFIFIVIHRWIDPASPGVMDDMFWASRSRSQISTFNDKPALEEFLKSNCAGPTYMTDNPCEVYEGEKLEFKVDVKTKTIKEEVEKEIEVGRQVTYGRKQP